MIKAIIFDLGDTLILLDRWDYDKCLLKLLRSLAHDNVTIPVSYEKFKQIYFEIRGRMCREAEGSLKEVDFCHRVAETLKCFGYNCKPTSPIIIRAVDAFLDAFIEDARIENYTYILLEQLKQNYKLGLISNFAYSKGFWKTMKHFNLTEYFDAIVVSGEIGVRKPCAKIFEKALKLLNVKASETVFVGDTLREDIVGAQKVGMKTILVENLGLKRIPYENLEKAKIVTANPDRKISSLRELKAALETL